MTRDEAQGLFVQLLLDKVRQDPFPSWTHMQLIEESIPRALIPDYLEVLYDKVGRDTFPSIPMLRRIQRVAGSLPRYEQRDP
jgi:hypothetical protein